MAAPLLTALLFQPVAPWPQAQGAQASLAEDAEAKGAQQQPQAATQLACSALAGGRTRLYVPWTYLWAIIALIAAYLGAIFTMDSIACDGTVECRNYSKLEWAFSQANVMETLDTWTPKGRAAMALSAGLHIFSSFLFAQLFIFGGVAIRERFHYMGWARSERYMATVPYAGRVFNVFYCTVHCLNASTVVSGNPSAATPVVVGVLLVIAIILLIVSALSIIVGAICCVVWRCCCARVGSAEGAAAPLTSAPVTAVVVVP